MALTDNIVAYYKLDEASGDASDSTSGGFTLTNNNSVPYSATYGKINNGARFNASNQYFSSLASGLQQNGNLSFSVWVKPNVPTGSRSALWCTYVGGLGFITALEKSAGVLYMRAAIYATGNKDFQSSVAVSSGSYSLLVFTYDAASGTIKFYLNGSLQHTEAGFPTSIPSTAIALFGIDGNFGVGNFYDGDADEIGLWSRVLSNAEVSELYNSGTGLQYPFTPPSNPPTVTTEAASSVVDVSAIGNGTITDEGVDTPDERGFVWGEASQGDPGDIAPVSSGYDDYLTEAGSFSVGAFTGSLSVLTPSTTYYYRAYAHNSDGYSYGDEETFVTTATPPFRFTNLPGVVYDPNDTITIFAERLNDILDRLDALEAP